MINLAREGFGKNNGVLKRNNNKIIIADVPDVAATTMLVSTNASHDRIPRANESSEVVQNNLSNNNYNDEVYLQTICVEIVRQEDRIRPGKIIHGLFGKKETAPLEHGIYAVEINDLSGSFKLCSAVSSERKICDFVPKIENQHILENLRINKIELSDAFCNEDEVDLLLGADLIGKLLTGKCVQLNFGLAAIHTHTKLGWTVIGKETGLAVPVMMK
ncbi:DUF1758 domain-containing protein [Trichonephila inaurata madagascariensis]|uniref:DUF1758 domain-containing protein n=1 Tax=Trichonephila inaurata madagascariensis TaxID=2747483 RepID=A0A8X6YU90_9ARAC|nr:DUF1758 domain-containing protein [Trichonephila inaurata madagascariensis]